MRSLLTALLLGAFASNSVTAQPTSAPMTRESPGSAQSSTTVSAAASPGRGIPAPPAASALAARSARFGFGLTEEDGSTTGPISLTAGTYAVFHTSEGDVLVRLLAEEAPKTVENFVGLATGRKPWKHPVTMTEMRSPLYNNTIIYKTVENALLYGGDPINRGVGEPGYTIPQEPSAEAKFDAPGVLAASLAGANSSGSRWFLALRSFPDWSSRYTIFGRVVGGLDVARAISRKPTKRPTVPLDPVLVNSIEIIEIPQGKKTVASYSTEEGKRFLTIEKNFTDDAAPVETKLAVADQQTTGAGETTTGTLAAAINGPASDKKPDSESSAKK